jgi:hypothetical protein
MSTFKSTCFVKSRQTQLSDTTSQFKRPGRSRTQQRKPKILHNLEICLIVAECKTSGVFSVISYNLKVVTIFETVKTWLYKLYLFWFYLTNSVRYLHILAIDLELIRAC